MPDEQHFDTEPARRWESDEFSTFVTAYVGGCLLVAWLLGSETVFGGYALFCAVVPIGLLAYYYILARAFRGFRPGLDRQARKWYDRIALAVMVFAVALCYGLWMVMARLV
jgi:hypothetical protein